MSSSDNANLWRLFAAGDERARAKLLERHYGLVHQTARRMAARLSDEVALEDLVGAGLLGLIRALDNFDQSRGIAFSTYAVPRIRGAILDDLRDKDSASRSLRSRQRELREVTERLAQDLGRAPTDHEVAAALDVDVNLLWRWKEALQALQTLPIDRPVGADAEDSATLADVVADPDADEADAEILRAERREALANAIKELKSQERLVLSLYYYEELKQSEIAEVLGVTESRVSQIRSKAIQNLREKMLAT